ncbi:membrane protein [Mycobacterium antarcticum]|uniref:low temperature requirement protein A n=1 Tax=Mycolicibacterium sp. TUM20985 TaxID=3023370 RepID=UPI002573EC8B|nr:low temperature requirement protein A [Mycolicibacterium sp. TUM20985]BDX31170.1 membrane protein [Mycolicibacterium sp. TUM20985]
MTESKPSTPAVVRAHRVRRMGGRDPHEPHRVATPLELLFDLTFVIAFGVAASELSHALAGGHVGVGLTGFVFAMFATCWAWINFTWFASAYDTDDWMYRILTMVQMVGVLILALGIPPFYASIEHGGHLDNALIVAGYVVMRVAMVAQWLRASRQDPERRPASLTYATVITVVQVGWIASIFLPLSVSAGLVVFALLGVAEMVGPWLAETRRGGTPWHAHHIAERYGLLAIIALGEGVVGTVASLTAVVGERGWTPDAVILAVAGTGLTFGMWWIYFAVPSADLLHAHRERSFHFGYLHIAVFGAIVATGAGLHTAAYYVEEQSVLGSVGTVLAVVIPVGVYIALIFVLYGLMVGGWDAVHLLLAVLTAGVLVGAVVAAAAGVPMTACLLIVTLAPVVSVVGFEVLGHRHESRDVDAGVVPAAKG